MIATAQNESFGLDQKPICPESLREKEVLKMSEVATLLNVSKRLVETWISNGRLKSVIMPNTTRSRRVTRDQLESFIQTLELEFGYRRMPTRR